MARSSYVATLLGSLESGIRKVVTAAFDYVLRNIRFGAVEHLEPSENFAGVFYEVTTSSASTTAFTFAHQLNTVPKSLIQLLPLNTTGAQLVRLTVDQVADANRVYLRSPDTGATFFVMVEV